MAEIIHFRSRYGHLERSGTSSQERRDRSPEGVSIRMASSEDDVRDIVWQRSTSSDIYARERYTHMGIGITVIFSGDFPGEKILYRDKLEEIIHDSADFTHFPYRKSEVNGGKNFVTIEASTLVFIFISSIKLSEYLQWEGLFTRNDIIFISILSPLEQNPGDTMFESSIIKSSYQRAFQERCSAIESSLIGGGASIVFLSMVEDPVLRLNHFFKHRYAR